MCGGPGPHHIFGFNPFGGGISQQAALGMQNAGMQSSYAMAQQLGMAGPSYGPTANAFQVFRTPTEARKPTMVCAYCGGPPYEERSCPGCGATTMKVRGR